MNNKVFSLKFYLRKSYSDADKLIEYFNQALNEGGRAQLILATGKNSFVLNIKVFVSENDFISLNSEILTTLKKSDILNITKFNMASSYGCKVKFEVENNALITATLLELTESLENQFEIMDLSATSLS